LPTPLDDWSRELAAAAAEALAGRRPGLERAAAWLEPADSARLAALLAAAARVRREAVGEQVELCAIVNAKSGRCSEDCAFCAQSSAHRTQARVYPLLDHEEILARSRQAADDGARRFSIVTSGRDCPSGRELDAVCRAVEAIRAEGRVLPCASLGLLAPEQARRLAAAGLVRYHHNLEAGPSRFPAVCTTHAYQDRVDTVLAAREAGLEVCVGGIVGLGESPRQRAELARAVGELEPESVPLNFLNPIPGTRLGHLPPLTATQALAAVAVFRLFAPRAHLRCCGGRHQVLGGLSPLMYLAGASAAMTGDYLTTQGRTPAQDRQDLADLGLTLLSQETA
jgi:biotin synthase